MGNVHNIKKNSKWSETAYISKKRSLYNLVFTVLNYHSSSDQVHLRNSLFKTSRRMFITNYKMYIRCIEKESSSKAVFLVKLYFCGKFI